MAVSDINPFDMAIPSGLDLAALLRGSGGPVNWEIARAIAQSMAGDADKPERWTHVEGEYDELVRAAEVQVLQYTGLSNPAVLTPVEVVSRSRWVDLHMDVFRPLVEPLARKMTEGTQTDLAGPVGEQLGNLLKLVMPVMAGLQTGALVGHLSHHVLGRYDLQLPPPQGQHRLIFVAPNLEEAERELNVVPRDFKFWIALRDAIRAIELAQPGIHERMTELVGQLAIAIEVDLDGAERFADINPQDMGAMQPLLENPHSLFRSLFEPPERESVEQMKAFIGLIDGYCGHVSNAIATDRIPGLSEIEGAIERRFQQRDDVEDMFDELVGFGLMRGPHGLGRHFCDTIVNEEGIEVLNRVWAGEESRPTLSELENPHDWIARTVGRRG